MSLQQPQVAIKVANI